MVYDAVGGPVCRCRACAGLARALPVVGFAAGDIPEDSAQPRVAERASDSLASTWGDSVAANPKGHLANMRVSLVSGSRQARSPQHHRSRSVDGAKDADPHGVPPGDGQIVVTP